MMGVLFDDWFDENFYNYIMVAVMLIVYGVLFIMIENRNKDKEPKINSSIRLINRFINWCNSGAFLMPSTSRSGVTPRCNTTWHLRHIAAEYSFSYPSVMFGKYCALSNSDLTLQV